MKIQVPLINTNLKVKFNLKINKKPKIEKLKKELSDYFDKHEICGNKINKFMFCSTNAIISEDIEKLLYYGDYEKDLNKIGEKYGIENLGFAHVCYLNH